MVGSAREGEVVDVGGAALGVGGDVMYLAVVARYVAARCRAAAVLGVKNDSLSW